MPSLRSWIGSVEAPRGRESITAWSACSLGPVGVTVGGDDALTRGSGDLGCIRQFIGGGGLELGEPVQRDELDSGAEAGDC